MESAVRTTISVTNSHHLVPPPLETTDVNKSWPSSPETLPRVRIAMRNGMEYADPQQEIPNLFLQELLPWNPTRYTEGGILRNAPLVQTPQSMLVNREEFGTKVQPRSDQNRLVAALADPSYLTWQGIPCWLGQVPYHLSHHSAQSLSDTPESWDNGQSGWFPYYEGLPIHFDGLSSFSSGGLQERPSGFPGRGPPGPTGGGPPGPLASQEEAPQVHLDHLVEVPLVCLGPWWRSSLDHLDLLVEVPQVHLALHEVVIQFPLVTWDHKAHPDSHSCGNRFCTIPKTLWTWRNLSCSCWLPNRQPMHNCSYEHSRIRLCKWFILDALRSLAESTQHRNFDHIFVCIPIYDGTNKEGFLSE